MTGPATRADDTLVEPDESIDRFRKRLQEALERAGAAAATGPPPYSGVKRPPQPDVPAVPAARRPRAGGRHARPR